MKKIIGIIFCFIYINPILSSQFRCPNYNQPPEEIQVDSSFTISPVYKNNKVTPVQIKNKIFIKESPTITSKSSYYSSINYCPSDFIIPTKEIYESIISQLDSSAYSVLTNKDGFNMTEDTYYLTSNKPTTGTYTFIFMYLEDGKVKLGEKDINQITTKKMNIRCVLSIPSTKILYPDYDGEIKYNYKTTIKTDGNYFNGYLWKVGNTKYTSSTIKPSFTQSGGQTIEFWGNLITGEIMYLCDYIFVKKKSVSSSQEYSDNLVKKIETNFTMAYSTKLHFEHSNCPVAPRIDGGYYIAVSDNKNYLHILSFDKNDILIIDHNTTDLSYVHDIVATDYGFVVYARDSTNIYHSYLNLYNKNFELINTIQIMNNKYTDDINVDSNLEKQIIKYDANGSPVYGMRFMFRPDNGKLTYSRGRIFLIFCHYNNFLQSGNHTGDTVVTFNDLLKDMDFGVTWGASHSLIQSVTFDEYYFWSAALSDAYPEGINVEYTSKTDFTNSYDPINKKKNSRVSSEKENLAGTITGYHDGRADGKLGGIMYFENLDIYCMIYAKTPNASNDDKNGKNIIYATTWKFSNKQYSSIETKEIKIFDSNSVMQIRAGKYGDNKIFIIYYEVQSSSSSWYGNVPKGTVPKVFIIQLPNFSYIKNDEEIKDLLMNTNEDLRTFNDGVLIWATSNKNGNLVINKIGTPRLDSSYDDINYIITKQDLIDYDNNNNNDNSKSQDNNYNEENDSLSTGAKFAIAIAIIFGILILLIGAFLLYKYFKLKKSGIDFNYNNLKRDLLYRY